MNITHKHPFSSVQNREEKFIPLNPQEVIAISAFIRALRALVDETLDQGYTIVDGKLVPPSKAAKAKSNS